MEQGIISSLGIGSGLDTASIVEQLVTAERQPRELQLDRQQQSAEARLSAFGQLAAALDRVDGASGAIANVSDSRSVSVSSSGLLAARADAGASIGSFTVETLQQAQAQSLASSTFTDAESAVGSGTLSLTLAGATVDLAIDSGNNTLAGIRDTINAADAGVSALIVDNGSGSQLLLTAAATGTANSIDIAVSDADGNNTDTLGLSALAFNAGAQNLTETVAARDAQLNVNGVTVTRPSNEFDDVIPGLNLNLLAAEPGTLTEVNVQRDESAAREAVSAFVDSLNNLSRQLNERTAFNQETGRAGALQGDSAARSLEARLRQGLVTELGTSNTFDQLVDIGITTASDGGIVLDETVFSQALESNFADVTELLAGAASQFSGLVDNFGEQSGLIGSRTDSLESRLENITDRRNDLDRRMEQVEARIRSEFSALDSLISDLQNTGNFLSSQLANLPQPGQ